jgi:hypothetical protein
VQHGYRRLLKVTHKLRSRVRIIQSCADTPALYYYPTLVPERMVTVIARAERVFAEPGMHSNGG